MNPFEQALSGALNYAIVSKDVWEKDNMVGFVYREAPEFERDSGWRCFSGFEDDEYTDNPQNFELVLVNDVCSDCPELNMFIQNHKSGVFGAWEWDEQTQNYVAVADWQPET